MFGLKVKITKLTAINSDIASFNCEKTLQGIAHIQKDFTTTLVLDGGYVLGVYDCPVCAMDGLHLTTDQIKQAEKDFGMTYENYKSVFISGLNATKH